MKKLIAFLLAFICLYSCAIGDSPATQTDLNEEYIIIDDDDWGSIDFEFKRKVYINLNNDPQQFGDEVELIAVLVDFQPEDKVSFNWHYTNQQNTDWIFIEDATKQIYTFILNRTNINNWYRVIVNLEGIK